MYSVINSRCRIYKRPMKFPFELRFRLNFVRFSLEAGRSTGYIIDSQSLLYKSGGHVPAALAQKTSRGKILNFWHNTGGASLRGRGAAKRNSWNKNAKITFGERFASHRRNCAAENHLVTYFVVAINANITYIVDFRAFPLCMRKGVSLN